MPTTGEKIEGAIRAALAKRLPAMLEEHAEYIREKLIAELGEVVARVTQTATLDGDDLTIRIRIARPGAGAGAGGSTVAGGGPA